MRSKRILAAAVAAIATAGTGTALAADDAWHVTDTQTQSGHSITQSANGRILGVTNGGLHVLVDCKATTSPNAAATGIKQCYLLGANGQRFDVPERPVDSNPGPVSTAGAVLTVPVQRYRTCVQASAYFQDLYSMTTTPVCTP